ncbi:MAG: hypothetical protein KDA80_18215, partial [Planctomycetaceae bacterium]|nr:hypothetical protein [Planctomycetaceae bacterium]
RRNSIHYRLFAKTVRVGQAFQGADWPIAVSFRARQRILTTQDRPAARERRRDSRFSNLGITNDVEKTVQCKAMEAFGKRSHVESRKPRFSAECPSHPSAGQRGRPL